MSKHVGLDFQLDGESPVHVSLNPLRQGQYLLTGGVTVIDQHKGLGAMNASVALPKAFPAGPIDQPPGSQLGPIITLGVGHDIGKLSS